MLLARRECLLDGLVLSFMTGGEWANWRKDLVSAEDHTYILPGAGQIRTAVGHLQCAREGEGSQKVVSRGGSTEGGWRENRSSRGRIHPRPSGLVSFVLASTLIHNPPA